MSTPKTLAAMLLLLAAAFPSVAYSVALPDYRKEAKKVHLRECDSSTTHVTMYHSATYYVTEAITDSGESFIMMYGPSRTSVGSPKILRPRAPGLADGQGRIGKQLLPSFVRRGKGR